MFQRSRPVCWCIVFHGSLLFSLYFCDISCNVLFFIILLLISVFSFFSPLFSVAKVCQFCLSLSLVINNSIPILSPHSFESSNWLSLWLSHLKRWQAPEEGLGLDVKLVLVQWQPITFRFVEGAAGRDCRCVCSWGFRCVCWSVYLCLEVDVAGKSVVL